MSQGNSKAPRFKIGDRVHIVNPPNQDWLHSQRGGNSVLPRTPMITATTRSLAAEARRLSLANGRTASLATNLTASTIYMVTSVNEAAASDHPPTYSLEPAEPLTVSVTEADILPAMFNTNDIVTLKGAAPVCSDLLRVEAVHLEMAGDLLPSSKRSYYGARGAIADDGEYEVIDSPFRARRTSLSTATLEERARIRVTIVDIFGNVQIMDADNLERAPEGSEWAVAEPDKFVGQ